MFVKADLEEILQLLNKLEEDVQPKWGKLTPQEMVEHLTDSLKLASGAIKQKLITPSEKIESMQHFLETDKEMIKNIKLPFAAKERVLRNENLSDAIDEFVEHWLAYESHFESGNTTELHPFYGELNFSQWQKFNSKHLTHHFKQFDIFN